MLRLRICFREVHQHCGDRQRQDQSAHRGRRRPPYFGESRPLSTARRGRIGSASPPVSATLRTAGSEKLRSHPIACGNPADTADGASAAASIVSTGVNAYRHLRCRADLSGPATGVDHNLRTYFTKNAATVECPMTWNQKPKLASKLGAVHRTRSVEVAAIATISEPFPPAMNLGPGSGQTRGIVGRFTAPARSTPGGADPAARSLGWTSKYPREYAGHDGRSGNQRWPLSDIRARRERENGSGPPGKHNINGVVDAIVSRRRTPSL